MKTTRVSAVLLAGVVGVAGLAACGTSNGDTVTVESGTRPTSTAVSTPNKRIPPEEEMEAALLSEGIVTPSGFAGTYATYVCAGLRQGDSSQMVLLDRVRAHPDYEVFDHAYMLGISVGTHCPQFSDQVMSEW